MLRSWLILISAFVGVAVPVFASAGVTVFQDPTNVGNPAAAPATISVGGPAVALNLFYQVQPVTAPSASNVCLSGTGDEVCGWDIHVSTSSPSVVLQSFTPDTGSGSDVVAAISGNVLRANGGNPVDGERGAHRIGTLLVSATAPGSVTVAGNLYVTAALAAASVTSGNTLATATTGGADTDSDGVPDAEDNCVNVANARVAPDFLTLNPWATLTGGQRDDDHDGFGNVCDGDFPGTPAATNVNGADTLQYKASLGRSRQLDICGTTGTQPCAIFDLNLTQDTDGVTNISGPDTPRYKALLGSPPGPKCPTCPLACTSGASGSCN